MCSLSQLWIERYISEWRCIKSQIWDKPMQLPLLFYCRRNNNNNKKQFQDVCSEFQEQIRIVNVYLEFQRGKKSEMWTVHSEFQEKNQNSKKNMWELWMLLKFQGEKNILRTKSGLWMYTWNSKWGKKIWNVDCTLRIQEKKCENCGCKVEIPRRKNYSKNNVRIVRWQESNWIARRKVRLARLKHPYDRDQGSSN